MVGWLIAWLVGWLITTYNGLYSYTVLLCFTTQKTGDDANPFIIRISTNQARFMSSMPPHTIRHHPILVEARLESHRAQAPGHPFGNGAADGQSQGRTGDEAPIGWSQPWTMDDHGVQCVMLMFGRFVFSRTFL